MTGFITHISEPVVPHTVYFVLSSEEHPQEGHVCVPVILLDSSIFSLILLMVINLKTLKYLISENYPSAS